MKIINILNKEMCSEWEIVVSGVHIVVSRKVGIGEGVVSGKLLYVVWSGK